jgi:hypothetical protein
MLNTLVERNDIPNCKYELLEKLKNHKKEHKGVAC